MKETITSTDPRILLLTAQADDIVAQAEIPVHRFWGKC